MQQVNFTVVAFQDQDINQVEYDLDQDMRIVTEFQGVSTYAFRTSVAVGATMNALQQMVKEGAIACWSASNHFNSANYDKE